MLLSESARAGVTIKTRCMIGNIRHNGQFVLKTDLGEMRSDKLVIASGGLSFPKVGATDIGYRLARQFGLKIVETQPSLVALVIKGDAYPEFAGISTDAVLTAGKQSFRENILFTHRGLSGPAILQISNYWKKGSPVSIDLAPEVDVTKAMIRNSGSRQTLGRFLGDLLPERLAQKFVEKAGADRQLANLSTHEIDQ